MQPLKISGRFHEFIGKGPILWGDEEPVLELGMSPAHHTAGWWCLSADPDAERWRAESSLKAWSAIAQRAIVEAVPKRFFSVPPLALERPPTIGGEFFKLAIEPARTDQPGHRQLPPPKGRHFSIPDDDAPSNGHVTEWAVSHG